MEGVKVTNFKKATGAGRNIFVGKNFVFVPGGMGAKSKASRVISRWGNGKIHVSGAEIDKSELIGVSLKSVSATKDLYNTGDTAYIVIADPINKGKDIELVVELNGSLFATIPIRLRDSGLALHAMTGLPEGEYTARIKDSETRFMVAQYKLVPLSARYTKRSFEKGIFKFSVFLESYGMPFDGNVRVELMQQRKKIDTKEHKSVEGLLMCELELPRGEEILTINFVSGDKSASLPIRGGKEKEREELVINPLGNVISCSTMPISRDKERGLFLMHKETNNKPFLVEEAVANVGKIKLRRKVIAGMIVVIDPVKNEIYYREEIRQRNAGVVIHVPVPKPYGVCFIGAILDDKPELYEGYTMFLHSNEIELDVKAPDVVKPGDEVVLDISVKNSSFIAEETDVLVVVQDSRISVSNTIETGLAAEIKKGMTKYKECAALGKPKDRLEEIANSTIIQSVERGGFLHSRRSRMDFYGPIEPLAFRSVHDKGQIMMSATQLQEHEMEIGRMETIDMFSMDVDAPVGTMYEHSKKETLTKLPEVARVKSPETTLCRLVKIENGKAQVAFRASQTIAKFTIIVQALSGFDWGVVEKELEVDKGFYGEFNVPPFVHRDDVVYGKLFVSCKSGRFYPSICCDRKPVKMFLDGKEIAQSEEIKRTSAVIEFEAKPGTYQAFVADYEDNRDASKVEVTEPGRFKHLIKSVKILTAGDAVSVEDYPNTIGISVMPGIEKDFRVLTRTTADYSHLCCEQTGGRIVSAIAMFCFSGNGSGNGHGSNASDDMRSAESIILAGIQREKSMWERGRGFRMYPEYDSISQYYSELATRYLLSSLGTFKEFPRITPALRKACDEGLEMARDVAKAHKITYPPSEAKSCRDVYEIWHEGSSGQAKQKALRFVRECLKAVDSQLCVKDGYMVSSRAETAFAAAVLFMSGISKDIIDGIKAANWVCSQFGPEGRFYSTIDSIAGVAMMQAMIDAGIVTGKGSVIVNNKTLSLEEAIKAREIKTIKVKEGVVAVQVSYIKEEDWAEYQGEVPVSVTIKSKTAPNFKVGEEADLVITLKDGYKPGDIAHICLPDCMSPVLFGGQIKKMALDFEGKSELIVPLAFTGSTRDKQTGKPRFQHFSICLRNMFEEERVGNPGMIAVAVN